jgi:hypothetical protein
MQRSKQPLGEDDHPDEQSGDEDDGKYPPDPSPTPKAGPHHREVTHDTDITLKILVDGEDRGHFLEFQTSVKV